MLTVGITGGIGSGKSVVARIFASMGIPVYYADIEARKLMTENPAVREKIISLFGPQAYTQNDLNRKFISSIVFTDPVKLQRLNDITHPAVLQDARDWFNKQTGPYAIKEAALIFESSMNQYLDYVIGVSAPVAVRLQRTMQRDQISETEVMNRMNKQMDAEEKMRKCDFVIDNSGHTSVIAQVIDLHHRLLNVALQKN